MHSSFAIPQVPCVVQQATPDDVDPELLPEEEPSAPPSALCTPLPEPLEHCRANKAPSAGARAKNQPPKPLVLIVTQWTSCHPPPQLPA